MGPSQEESPNINNADEIINNNVFFISDFIYLRVDDEVRLEEEVEEDVDEVDLVVDVDLVEEALLDAVETAVTFLAS